MLRALAVVPELAVLSAQDRDAAIVTRLVIGHRTGKTDIQIARTLDDLVAPVGVNLA
jgi:hypothetical protein